MGTKRVVRWTKEEWISVLRELYKIEPIVILSSSTMAGISTTAVAEAGMKALPPERHRPKTSFIQNAQRMRQLLLAHRDEFKQRLIDEGVLQNNTPTPAPQEEIEEKLPDYPAPELPTPTNPFEIMMDQLADRLIERLLPRLVERLGQVMAELQPTITVSGPAFKPSDISHMFKPELRIRNRRIGIVGLLPIQAESLKSKFRDIDFIFDEGYSAKGLREKFGSCEMIFNLVSKGNHAADGMLSKWANEKYRRVSGGPSAVERNVRIYLNQQ